MISNKIEFDRNDMIHELQSLAEEVLELKKTFRQKRPIVIEFSGSPKSGKTSCINSLELFLKRNEFTVEIIHERASVCPVNNKKSPMFNVWTACMSIAGMVGVLERKAEKCDVLILDRGIFDALCWFNWLSEKKVIEQDQRKAIDSFLLMDSLVSRIDIVFTFYADPDVSIAREYATLLTNKLGSIMNKEVLAEYHSSISKTIKEKQDNFHSIIEIDTSEKTQNEVGKDVTDKTLATLRNLLMEKIAYFEKTTEFEKILLSQRVFSYSELIVFLKNMQFDLRSNVENTTHWLQPIPIVVITNTERDKVLSIKKKAKAVSNDSPEKDKLLLYVGGHPRNEDVREICSNDFLSICRTTLRREMDEEIGQSFAIDEIEPFFIYTPDSPRSKQHLGVCFVKEVDIDSIQLQLDPYELVTTKGQTKSGRFQNIHKLKNLEVEYESWSKEILKKVFNISLSDSSTQLKI